MLRIDNGEIGLAGSVVTDTHVRPIDDREFAEAMAVLGPFETPPRLAVGVSGGMDSMALALLARRWAVSRGGCVFALVVDHGLRPESGTEAQMTAARLRDLGMSSEILHWQGDKPRSGLQAAAREARLALLETWCRTHGILHLALAHHADDQAETFLLRLERGSGPDGLAAMSPLRHAAGCRIVRPLLGFRKRRLAATLGAAGVDWVDDPSNTDPRFGRTEVRRRLRAGGFGIDGFAAAASRFARVRETLERTTDGWLACHVRLASAGYAALMRDSLRCAEPEIRIRALRRVAATIGGGSWRPPVAAVERLERSLAVGRGATLAGARFVIENDRIGVYRERRNLPASLTIRAETGHWDGRLVISVDRRWLGARLEPWSETALATWPRGRRPRWFEALPAVARPGLVVVRGERGLLVPGPGRLDEDGICVRFRPRTPLTGNGFSIA